ncbi:hypothetical protein [uncultured Mucilaginibacter sp.]|uniref:hypothetical protein n=1 Tax=uncultured Mucilaginibacter sp. TaxID=797541 RepID=UPI0025DE87AC|nr:hypothetical protein [uncultured Mucilaginibacter sp.]
MKYNDENFILLLAKESSIRGRIITMTIILERAIDKYLCVHFSNDLSKQHELMNYVFGTDLLSFDRKRQIFQFLTEKHDNVFNGQNKNIHKTIEKIMQERNVVAHSLLNHADEAVDAVQEGISFIKFKNKRSTVSYTNEQVEKHLRVIFNCIAKVTALNMFISSLPHGDR